MWCVVCRVSGCLLFGFGFRAFACLSLLLLSYLFCQLSARAGRGRRKTAFYVPVENSNNYYFYGGKYSSNGTSTKFLLALSITIIILIT